MAGISCGVFITALSVVVPNEVLGHLGVVGVLQLGLGFTLTIALVSVPLPILAAVLTFIRKQSDSTPTSHLVDTYEEVSSSLGLMGYFLAVGIGIGVAIGVGAFFL